MESVVTVEGREQVLRDCGEEEEGKAKGRRYLRVYSLQPHFLPLVSIMFQIFMCSVYARDRREGLAPSLPQRNMSLKTVKLHTGQTSQTTHINTLAYYFSRASKV